MAGPHGDRAGARHAAAGHGGARGRAPRRLHQLAVGRGALLLHRGLHDVAVGLRRAALLLHGRVRRLHGNLCFLTVTICPRLQTKLK